MSKTVPEKLRNYVAMPIACSPAGTISFVSKAAGGSMSDKELVKRSGLVDLFSPEETKLADRGFNIQELLLHEGVKFVIPPFLKGKNFQRLKTNAPKK